MIAHSTSNIYAVHRGFVFRSHGQSKIGAFTDVVDLTQLSHSASETVIKNAVSSISQPKPSTKLM